MILMLSAILGLIPVDSTVLVEPPPLWGGAYAYAPAVRLDPPDEGLAGPPLFNSDSANGRCVGAEPLLAYYSPGWSVERMSRIMYRESRCSPRVRNGSSGSTGLLQVMPSNCRYLAAQMGEPCTVARLSEPVYNVRAARELWEYDGYRPWAL
jgi:hypothetical protein